MKSTLLKIARILFPAIGFAVVGYYFWTSAQKLPSIALDDPSFWAYGMVATLFALAAFIVGGISWYYLIVERVPTMPVFSAVGIMLSCQIGKYLPGNVGHYVGRIALAKKYGVSLHQGVMSIMVETLMTISAGVILTALFWYFDPAAVEPLTGYLPAMVIALPLLISVGIAPLLIPWAAKLVWLSHLMPKYLIGALSLWPTVTATIRILLLQSLAFGLLGIGLYFVVLLIRPESTITIVYVTVIFIAAWVIGTMTPGAPGGLGVREGVLVVGFTPFMEAGDAVVIALTFRVITIAADGMAFFVGEGLRLIVKKQQTAGASKAW